MQMFDIVNVNVFFCSKYYMHFHKSYPLEVAGTQPIDSLRGLLTILDFLCSSVFCFNYFFHYFLVSDFM